MLSVEGSLLVMGGLGASWWESMRARTRAAGAWLRPGTPLRRGQRPRETDDRRRVAAACGGVRTRLAVTAGRFAAGVSRRLGVGGGSVIAGRVAFAVSPRVLSRLASGRTSIVVTGTNGKTTTSHFVAAALSGRGPVAHNAAGSNMPDGAVAALIAAPRARLAVLEIDELHLGEVLDAVVPDVLVLLNLSRDQLDRVSEVRTTAAAIHGLLIRHQHVVVIANADDPLVVWAAGTAGRVVWVAAGTRWQGDTLGCPRCGHRLERHTIGEPPGPWHCTGCGLRRPSPRWWWQTDPHDTIWRIDAAPIEVRLSLPGRVNLGNATMALAAVAQIGTDPAAVAPALGEVTEVAGRYGRLSHRGRTVRVLLVKNPAGWGEALDMLPAGRSVLVMVNAREADGRDVSWLWDLSVDGLRGRAVAVAGERAADAGVRLSYADIPHRTDTDLRRALDLLPPGPVDALANYTAFLDLKRSLDPHGPQHLERPSRDTPQEPLRAS